MHPNELPRLGVITNAEGHGHFFGEYSKLEGKRLLCIGFSEMEVTQYVAPHRPESVEILTYWADHIDAKAGAYPVTLGDITKRTSYPDDSFDAVLTLAVLEHLNDLPGAFQEMTRLVKPGGELLHLFGPAWSCAYGHHLYVNDSDPNLNFSCWTLPAHMHLLCSAAEVTDFYRELGYSDATIQWVIDGMFKPTLINRQFYDVYGSLMNSANLQLDRMELMYNALPADHLRRLRAAYPGHVDFSTYGGRYRLIVRK